MRCFHINIRQATFIILSIIVNNVSIIQMVDNNGEKTNFNNIHNRQTPGDLILNCPSNVNCIDLPPKCLNLKVPDKCIYGKLTDMTFKVKESKLAKIIDCNGNKTFTKKVICRFCYQTEPWEHTCTMKATCSSVSSPRERYVTNCTVNDDILCLGNREFNKNVLCNWTGGYRWTTALILSITLGGFGADRFYLGHWQAGIGKLFSFGGLGVWTIIDVILISLHYLGPADESLYI